MFANFQELEGYINKNGIMMLDFKIPELSGKWRHLTIPAYRVSEKVFKEGFGFDGSNYGYTAIEASDMVYIPDYTTAFRDPFWERPTLSFLGNIYAITPQGEILFQSESRNILKRAVRFMQKTGIADQLILGPEFEYYVLDKISYWNQPQTSGFTLDSQQAYWNTDMRGNNQGYKISYKDGYQKGAPYDVNRNLRSAISLAIEELGIEVKYHHHEVGGPGQHEIEIKRADAEKMADAAMLIKYIVKNMAFAYGKTATFMPKPIYGEAGSGFHVHLQLFKNGEPLFAGSAQNYAGLSEIGMQFMGGILKHTQALMALAGPTTNSYKRLVRGYEAPVAICFATANRSAVIRIPGYATNPYDKRFEFRPADASGNPYLTFAALLMAGLDGMKNKIDPVSSGFGPIDKNIYELSGKEREQLQYLPTNLNQALAALKEDHQFLLEGEIFSRELIENWIISKKQETEEVNNFPSPKEFELYFDV